MKRKVATTRIWRLAERAAVLLRNLQSNVSPDDAARLTAVSNEVPLPNQPNYESERTRAKAMPRLRFAPRYPSEWLRFVRAPVAYVKSALTLESDAAYEPWAAFGTGFIINAGFAVYEAHRWGGTFDKATEQLFLLIVLVVNVTLVHAVCRRFGGQGSIGQMATTFEYVYGFLVPTAAVSMTILLALTELFPGIRGKITMGRIDFTNLIPTTTNVIIMSLVQTIVVGLGIYIFIILNLTFVEVQRIKNWKVLCAQLIGLGVLAVVGPPLYSVSYWVTKRFADLTGLLGD